MAAQEKSTKRTRIHAVTLAFVLANALVFGGCTRQRPELPEASSTFTAPLTATPRVGRNTELPALTPHVTPADGQATPTNTVEALDAAPAGREQGITEGDIEAEAPTPAETGQVATAAPAPTTVVATTPTLAARTGPTTYVVKPGDTMFAIARQFGLSVDALAAANRIADPTELRAGLELTIPASGTGGTPQPGGGGYVHVVQGGETLFGIAQKYGIALNRLAEANGITNPSAIRTGQELIIPSGASQTPATGGQRVHVVQPGETLTAIAAKYGVTPAAIAQANGLTEINRIVTGQQLIIP